MRSIKIGNKDTATDWDLILTDIELDLPVPKTEYIDIPLGNGSIDMTEALTGVVNYDNRKCKFSFDMICKYSEREAKIAEIASHCHGKRHKLVLPDDPDHYYMGRISISPIIRGSLLNQFKMNVVIDPFRYKNTETVIIKVLSGEPAVAKITINHTGRPVIPVFENDKEVTFKRGTITQVISAGKRKYTGMIIREGLNEFEFSGMVGTTITLTYREEVL